jgi:hypothetical protein
VIDYEEEGLLLFIIILDAVLLRQISSCQACSAHSSSAIRRQNAAKSYRAQ